ncbi:8471_t:CDS:2 [Gigaspora margarita]|uniref:8471_t:CDS:1 n=1 Tax=Gigaspora margarita TaxID=4874 RepID=A0ABN7UXP3_GIGMA|nr:8471_t:CDS:2 [Gigaspora margarita]
MSPFTPLGSLEKLNNPILFVLRYPSIKRVIAKVRATQKQTTHVEKKAQINAMEKTNPIFVKYRTPRIKDNINNPRHKAPPIITVVETVKKTM